MTLHVAPGKYIVAVSGGVDSVVLLHMLMRAYSGNNNYTFIVAHFDHGIRPDSAADATFVKGIATHHHLPFISERQELGVHASELAARNARYAFFGRVRAENMAQAVLTAHHQDDLLETMILNILRGTGRRGLDPLRGRAGVLRPLLHTDKASLVQYATVNNLIWHEDSTNASQLYLRNAVRLRIMPALKPAYAQLLRLNNEAHERNKEISGLLNEVMLWCTDAGNCLVRCRFVTLPHGVAAECMYELLSAHAVPDLTTKMVHRAVIAAKTAFPGQKISLNKGLFLVSEATSVKIV